VDIAFCGIFARYVHYLETISVFFGCRRPRERYAMIKVSPIEARSLMGVAHDIRNIARAGDSSGDDRYSLRQIMFWIETHAADLRRERLKEDEAEGKELREDWIQEFTCKALEVVDLSHCSCVKFGCTIKRVKLPILSVYKGKLTILYLGRSDFRMGYFLADSPQDAEVYAGGVGRFGRANPKPAYYIQGGYAYIVFPPEYALTETVGIVGVESNPLTATPLPVIEGKTLNRDIWCEAIPIKDDEIAEVRKRILGREMGITVQYEANNDQTNNANSR
jgi:hypothetical protein